ncbi:hypothetical protein KIN34_02585 [Cellulomonas sp. DKR-3]|uniref:Lipoprotein n=1 Tax=Cellulomonas fulva TaxID=2835530 RepID=A0ABS5TVK3_9CELL|nr:hypothetical protein [Cellulomonas fulva]MBT0993176.1 hypothetical protein [Cellulomonas fulva]
MTSLRPRRPGTRAVAAAAGLAVGLLLAGCSATNPIQTEHDYSPSDGVRVTVGDVRGNNLMLLTSGEGAPGVLHGAFTNDATEDRTVTVSFAGADGAEATDATTVQVPARSTVLLDGTEDEGRAEVSVAATPVAPGDVATITLETDADGSTDLQVPVLDGTLPDYATSVPSPSAS